MAELLYLNNKLIIIERCEKYLNPKVVVHHINEITSDNRIENLMLFKDRGDHSAFHNTKRICSNSNL